MSTTENKILAGARTQTNSANAGNTDSTNVESHEETDHASGTWYENTKPGAVQGLIYDAAGKNVAVSYDPKDAALIAAAPEQNEALRLIIAAVDNGSLLLNQGEWNYNAVKAVDAARAVIAKVEESK